MINLEGWSLEEISSTQVVFHKDNLKITGRTVYPTLMKDGYLTVILTKDNVILTSRDNYEEVFDYVKSL